MRGLFEGGDEASHVESEAQRRNFPPDSIRAMVDEIEVDDLVQFMQGNDEDELSPQAHTNATEADADGAGPPS